MDGWNHQDILAVRQLDQRLVARGAVAPDIATRVGRVPERADFVENVGVGLERLAVGRVERVGQPGRDIAAGLRVEAGQALLGRRPDIR